MYMGRPFTSPKTGKNHMRLDHKLGNKQTSSEVSSGFSSKAAAGDREPKLSSTQPFYTAAEGCDWWRQGQGISG